MDAARVISIDDGRTSCGMAGGSRLEFHGAPFHALRRSQPMKGLPVILLVLMAGVAAVVLWHSRYKADAQGAFAKHTHGGGLLVEVSKPGYTAVQQTVGNPRGSKMIFDYALGPPTLTSPEQPALLLLYKPPAGGPLLEQPTGD
jgi:hypothetical protein